MYTSGRTVKSSKTQPPTTVASATKAARKLADALIAAPGVTVDSARTADPDTLAAQVRTTVTFAAGSCGSAQLAVALNALPGVARLNASATHITVVRNV